MLYLHSFFVYVLCSAMLYVPAFPFNAAGMCAGVFYVVRVCIVCLCLVRVCVVGVRVAHM